MYITHNNNLIKNDFESENIIPLPQLNQNDDDDGDNGSDNNDGSEDEFVHENDSAESSD